ncbi:hypothetical protein J7F03_35780 [Streptomyces sp. ISL-43]|uniref:hypothetical protein n=1 Tax=Streptomyces sp. ISL-43 TaxID=2819183 RepID=UPI001BEC8238|nr:hypothetical protein [Streptomyces sp. ISL-43]MBT2452329.1 hypothetical protein [Streptomyces sp. ISL-43]
MSQFVQFLGGDRMAVPCGWDALKRRIEAAQASLELVECALDCYHDDITQCPHFQAIVRPEVVSEVMAFSLCRRSK